MICEECKKESNKEDVCTNCGLVYVDRPIIGQSPRSYDGSVNRAHEFNSSISPLSPNIKYLTKYNRKTKNKELSGAIKRTSNNMIRDEEWQYLQAFKQIGKICAFLQLSDNIKNESLNIFKEIKKREMKFRSLEALYFGCIRVGCKIHGFPLKIKELYELAENPYKIIRRVNRNYMNILKCLKLNIRKYRMNLKNDL